MFERVDDHSIEADVVATNDGVLRYCKRCGNSTIWKVGQPGALPVVPANASAPSADPRQPSMPMAPPLRVSSPSTLSPAFNPPSQPSFQSTPQPDFDASAYSAAPPSDLIAGLPNPAARTSITSPVRSPKPYTPSGSSQSPSVLTLPASEKPAEKAASPQKSAQKSGFPGVNRRKYPRIKVNYIGLVRHPERGEEFVQCEDISRRRPALQKH